MSIQTPIYLLHINTSTNPLIPRSSFYASGISAVDIPLEKVVNWEIYRTIFLRGKPVKRSLNNHFIAFQKLWKAYRVFLRRVRSTRFLLDRETTGARFFWTPPPIGILYADSVSTLRLI